MGSEWKSTTLGEVIELKRGYDLPKRLRVQGDVPLISSAGVSDFHSESKVAGPGVVTGRYGTIGEVFYSLQDFWPLNTTLYVRDFKGNNPKFVYYFLKTLNFDEFSDKAAVPGVNRNHVHMAQVTVPTCISEQKAIAHILGTLDDKIELNRRMNTTLEGMAQALFKSWFVDFDPVIDNALAAGNPIPEELAPRANVRKKVLSNSTTQQGSIAHPTLPDPKSLFPAAFEFTEELGWIPEGWGSRLIGDSFQLLGGHSFKSGDYVENGQFGIVTIKNVQDGNFVQECSNEISEVPPKMKSHCYLKSGDVLLSLTGNVGRACVVSEGEYLLNQRVSKIVGRDGIPEAFGYFFFRQESLYERMITIAKGTAQQNLSPIETAKLEQVMPSNRTIAALGQHLREFHTKMVSNTTQGQILAKLRDALLPKLISGDLRLTDPNELVAELAG